jgi:hypothetical protein
MSTGTVRPAGSWPGSPAPGSAALDNAWDTALSELPVELRQLARQYAEKVRQGQEIGLALTSAMTGTE